MESSNTTTTESNSLQTTNNNIPAEKTAEKEATVVTDSSTIADSVENGVITTPRRRKTAATLSKSSPRQRNLQFISFNEDNFESGYDTDGDIGPFNYVEDIEGKQDFDEIDIKKTNVNSDEPAEEDVLNAVLPHLEGALSGEDSSSIGNNNETATKNQEEEWW